MFVCVIPSLSVCAHVSSAVIEQASCYTSELMLPESSWQAEEPDSNPHTKHQGSGSRLLITTAHTAQLFLTFTDLRTVFFWLLTGTNEKSLCNSLQYSALTQSLCQISSCPTQLCSSCCVKTQNVRVYPPSPVLIVLKQTTINDDNYTREIHWRKEKAFTVTNQRYNGA